MMGFAIPNLEAPMTKGSSGLVIMNQAEAASWKKKPVCAVPVAWIVCPLNLMPQPDCLCREEQKSRAGRQAGLNDCMK